MSTPVPPPDAGGRRGPDPANLRRAAPDGDLWRVMFDASPFACSVVDIASGTLVVNHAYRTLLGIGPEEDVTMANVRRRSHPDEIDELNRRFAAMDRGEVDRIEIDRRYVRDDGTVFWGHLVTTLVRDEAGEPVAVVGQVEDITDRVEAQRQLAAREARFRSLVQRTVDTVVVTDAAGRILYGAPAPGDPAAGTGTGTVSDLVHADDRVVCQRLIEFVAVTPLARTRLRVRLPACGPVRMAEVVATNLLDDPDVGGIVVTLRDVTETQQQLRTIREQAVQLDKQNHRLAEQAEQLVRARDQAVETSRLHALRFEAGFEHSPIGIALVEPDSRIQRVNPALCRMLGEGPAALNGRSLAQLVEPDSLADARAFEELCRHRAASYAAECRCRRGDGAVVWADVHIASLADGDGRHLGFFAQIQDITARRRSELALAHQATHDSLTGLANRHHFLTRSQHVIRRARGPGEDVALLFIDVDRFKIINDSLGHAAGDQLLHDLSRRFTAALPGAEVARLGGDEFGVMAPVPAGSPAAAQALADRLHAACAPAFTVHGHELNVSLSIGIVCSPEPDTDTAELLRRADAAMYRAKAAGRSTSRFLDDSALAALADRFELSGELGRAIERDQLFLAYQPEVDLVTGELVGVEALVRWRHPARGVLPATAFVPVAEECGLIMDIGTWVLRTAVAQAASWSRPRGRPPIVTRVNLAPHQLGRDRLAAQVRDLLDAARLAPEELCLETTEQALLHYGEAARRNIEALAALGVQLAVDDFGTGHSSFAYLKDCPARTLKVDMSFVHGVERDGRDHAIVATMLDLADRLGYEVVAEGVESPRQATILETLGCRRAQGHLFGHPTTPAAIERLLAAHPAAADRVGLGR